MTQIVQIYEHQCDECDFVTDSASYLSTHKTVKHRDEGRVYSCDICFQTFTFSVSVKQHKKDLHHNKTFKCNKCDHISNSKRTIERHEARAHFPDCDVFEKCNFCGKNVKRKGLKRHEKDHQRVPIDKSLLKFHCKKCNYKTTTSTNLRMHDLKKHPLYQLTCDHCSFVTAWEARLNVHIIKHHPIIKCDTCTFETNVKHKMKTHKRKYHKNITKCKQCDFTSISDAHLKMHLCKEHGESIMCGFNLGAYSICEFESNIYEDWEDHRKSKHQSKFHACKGCNFISFNKNDLSPHSVQSHGHYTKLNVHIIQNHPIIQCDTCTFETNVKYKMKSHKRKYHPSKCKQCDFTSISDAYLKMHSCKEHGESIMCEFKFRSDPTCEFESNKYEGEIYSGHDLR